MAQPMLMPIKSQLAKPLVGLLCLPALQFVGTVHKITELARQFFS